MTQGSASRALHLYSQVDVETSVNSASPGKLIVLLYDGALGAIAMAKGELQKNNFSQKGRFIIKATSILEALHGALDFDKGGEIAIHLRDLYEYMEARLLEAHRHNNIALLDEVTLLLTPLRGAWAAIVEGQPVQPFPAAQQRAANAYVKA